MELMIGFMLFDEIKEKMGELSPEAMQCVLCMMVDYVASKSGMSSASLLEKLTPAIIVCNEALGAMEV